MGIWRSPSQTSAIVTASVAGLRLAAAMAFVTPSCEAVTGSRRMSTMGCGCSESKCTFTNPGIDRIRAASCSAAALAAVKSSPMKRNSNVGTLL